MSQNVEVVVFEEREHRNEWPPDYLDDAITWLQEKLASVPEEYRSETLLEIGSDSNWDVPHATIKISYSRPETQEEVASREAHEVAGREAAQRDEYRRFLEMKAKFEGAS